MEDEEEEEETEEGEIDPSRSEGIVEFVITEFSQVSHTRLSDPVYIRNLPWYACVCVCVCVRVLLHNSF